MSGLLRCAPPGRPFSVAALCTQWWGWSQALGCPRLAEMKRAWASLTQLAQRWLSTQGAFSKTNATPCPAALSPSNSLQAIPLLSGLPLISGVNSGCVLYANVSRLVFSRPVARHFLQTSHLFFLFFNSFSSSVCLCAQSLLFSHIYRIQQFRSTFHSSSLVTHSTARCGTLGLWAPC